jgi:antirestriction protein ArdC
MGGDDGYYATLLHELLHATGHPTLAAADMAISVSGEALK